MREYKDQEILEGILNDDNRILNYVYKKNLPRIKKLIVRSGGEENMANDIFQECMIIIFEKIKSKGLVLSCKFSTYFYSVCKKLWYQEIKYGDRLRPVKHRIKDDICVEEPEYEYEKSIFQVFDKHFEALSEDCKKILKLHFDNYSIDEIKEIMSYKNSHYVMDKKYRCKKSLIKRIMNDPLFKEINNELK
jgi:RNA polymerase sigma factor (sigma-70 family)